MTKPSLHAGPGHLGQALTLTWATRHSLLVLYYWYSTTGITEYWDAQSADVRDGRSQRIGMRIAPIAFFGHHEARELSPFSCISSTALRSVSASPSMLLATMILHNYGLVAIAITITMVHH